MSQSYEKFAAEKLSYAIDWATVLANENDGDGDTIATSTWVISPTGLTQVGSATIDTANTRTVIRVSGGTVGEVYTLTNRITLTTTGDILEDYIRVKVV